MSEEKKDLTAQQLFNCYMRSVAKVRNLSESLTEEVTKADNLSRELAARFGIYVTGSKPAAKLPLAPITAPSDSAGAGDGGEPAEFKPPAQYHADAPALSSPGSSEVAEIRRDAGLSVDAEDSEALASEGLGMMEQLHKTLPGAPSVVATPGEHHDRAAAQERSNAEGGPVRQGPVTEE